MRRAALIGAAIAAAAALGLVARCRPDPAPVSARTREKLTALAATQPAFNAGHAATTAAITTVVTKIVRDEAEIDRIRAEAERQRARADSLARATAADSATHWRLAYDARTREAEGLRTAVDTLERDLHAAHDTLSRAKIQLGVDARRIADNIAAEADLRRDLSRAAPPCAVLYVFRCPSRTEAFVAGVVVASATAYVATHPHQVQHAVHTIINGVTP